jgi:hypothetical protein
VKMLYCAGKQRGMHKKGRRGGFLHCVIFG